MRWSVPLHQEAEKPMLTLTVKSTVVTMVIVTMVIPKPVKLATNINPYMVC